ncbi:MAG: RidA family protein [Nitrospiraceae bacterium]|nr:RidA family protein [Nitrospiraceae bacterium]
MGRAEDKIKAMGLEFPARNEKKSGVIESVKQAGDFIFVSGHGPQQPDGSMAYIGKLGKELTTEQGYKAAKLCALSCLGGVKTAVDSLDQIEIISVRGFVSSTPDFYDQPEVMNGTSELLLEVFGERGRHARTAIATPVLPGNIAVEVQMVVRVVPE